MTTISTLTASFPVIDWTTFDKIDYSQANVDALAPIKSAKESAAAYASSLLSMQSGLQSGANISQERADLLKALFEGLVDHMTQIGSLSDEEIGSTDKKVLGVYFKKFHDIKKECDSRREALSQEKKFLDDFRKEMMKKLHESKKETVTAGKEILKELMENKKSARQELEETLEPYATKEPKGRFIEPVRAARRDMKVHTLFQDVLENCEKMSQDAELKEMKHLKSHIATSVKIINAHYEVADESISERVMTLQRMGKINQVVASFRADLKNKGADLEEEEEEVPAAAS